MLTQRCKEVSFRNKITGFSFIFSLLVIWAHSYNAELYLGKTSQAEEIRQIQRIFGEQIGQIAVPGFFMISAYLFYRNFTWKKLGNKWLSRIHSIVIPYILWNFIYYIGYMIASRIPWLTDVVGKGVVPLSVNTLMDAVLFYQYNYVFWYLFQLILLVILAPALYFVLKNQVLGIGIQIGLWILLIMGIQIPYLNLDALIYYSLGAYLAIHCAKTVEALYGTRGFILGALGLIFSYYIYQTGLRYGWIPGFVLSRLGAVISLWLLISAEIFPNPKEFMKHVFFLYAIHFAWVRLLNKVGAILLPNTAEVAMILFLCMPILMLMISEVIGRWLKRKNVLIWNVLNGNR